MSDYLQDLLSGLTGVASEYVQSEVRVTLETNMAPPLTVYSGGASATGGGGRGVGLGKLLGIRGGIVVRDAKGNKLASFGDPQPMSYLRTGILLLAAGGIVYLIVRGMR